MLRSVKTLNGYSIRATDGEIGTVDDFYFDDSDWKIRYLIVKTGAWLFGRRVLIPPAVIGQPDWSAEVIPVNLTQEQVKNSPDIDTNKPVSRQQEETKQPRDVPVYLGGTPYFAGTHDQVYLAPQVQAPTNDDSLVDQTAPTGGDIHLRSANEIVGYGILAEDGDMGRFADFIVDDEEWIIRYAVADTGGWLPGKKVVLAPPWIRRISWTQKKVIVDLKKEEIKGAPEFDPSVPINRQYEVRLYDFYGRPKYWS